MQELQEQISTFQLEVLQLLEDELFAEALAASASRLTVRQLTLGKISILLDLHISESSRFAPFAIDTHG